MMRLSKLKNFSTKIYLGITSSIAFYPAVLSVLMLVLAWLCVFMDTISMGTAIAEKLDFLSVEDNETARSLLSSLVGGLISLMVFSFSMVMIVLNQAATNYSPRVLPGLVSQREHQLVLGLYLGTIGYTLALLSNVGSEIFGAEVPRFAILMNIFLGFICIIAFVYFIHTISTVIQIGNIIESLHRGTRRSLIRELSSGKYEQGSIVFNDVHQVKAWQSGYFFRINEANFISGAEKFDLQAKLLIREGIYVLDGEPILEVNQPIKEEIIHLVKDSVIFRHQENIENNYFHGFKQITEVAVKALSPGINDPGTALQAINYLSDLFNILMRLKGERVVKRSDGKPGLVYLPVPFLEIFHLCVSGIRNYAEKDVAVQVKLIKLIRGLGERDRFGDYAEVFRCELEAMEEAAGKTLNSSKDIAYLKSKLR